MPIQKRLEICCLYADGPAHAAHWEKAAGDIIPNGVLMEPSRAR